MDGFVLITHPETAIAQRGGKEKKTVKVWIRNLEGEWQQTTKDCVIYNQDSDKDGKFISGCQSRLGSINKYVKLT